MNMPCWPAEMKENTVNMGIYLPDYFCGRLGSPEVSKLDDICKHSPSGILCRCNGCGWDL